MIGVGTEGAIRMRICRARGGLSNLRSNWTMRNGYTAIEVTREVRHHSDF
jgi:hypothetical protein